jgi:hypothetical protein
MEAPATIKDVQKLTGYMASLNRFISRLGRGRVGTVGSETTPTVTHGPHSTTAGRKSTTLYCGDNSCHQQCHRRRALQGGPCICSAEARVLRQ